MSTLAIKMYRYIVNNSSTLLEGFLESIFKFSHLIIRGLIKGIGSTLEILIENFGLDPPIPLSPNYAIFSTSCRNALLNCA